MKSTSPNVAYYVAAIARGADGIVRAHIEAGLPNAEPYEHMISADPNEFDEVTSLMADFHNEWKSWGSLLDCVLDEWSPQVRTLF